MPCTPTGPAAAGHPGPNLYQVFSNSGPLAGNNQRFAFCPHCATPFGEAMLARCGRQQCVRCGFVHYLNPSPGVTVIVRDAQNRVLIGRRVDRARYGGRWCLPGGYIEYEESFLDTARREVREETGLSIRLCGIVNVVSNLLDDLHHTLVIILLAEVAGGRAEAADDLDALRWVDPAAHATMPYAFEADKRVIDWYFAGDLPVLPIDRRHEAR